jgi:formate/nitrite transporter
MEASWKRLPPAVARPVALVSTPSVGYASVVTAGANKAAMRPLRIVTLGVLSGIHIGIGAFLMVSVGRSCPDLEATNPGLARMVSGAFGLPFGTLMTLLTGAESCTVNCAFVVAALLEGKATLRQLSKSLSCAFVGNFVGAVLLAGLAHMAGLLGASSSAVAVEKVGVDFGSAFCRGILCNWLVCMAAYMAAFSNDLIGKAIVVWLPVSAFVALGLDHAVANMFLIPAGMLAGAPVTLYDFLIRSLLPVTLGNVVGGSGFMIFPYCVAVGSVGQHIEEAARHTSRRIVTSTPLGVRRGSKLHGASSTSPGSSLHGGDLLASSHGLTKHQPQHRPPQDAWATRALPGPRPGASSKSPPSLALGLAA